MITLRLLMLSAVLACLSGTVTAQFTNIGGGCPGALPLLTTGTPAIGTCPTVDSPAPLSTPCVLMLGIEQACSYPLSCNPLCCLKCTPIIFQPHLAGTPVTLPIPDDTDLIGKKACVQSAWVFGFCFKMSEALEIEIEA